MFLIGAGCSQSAGIKLASEVATQATIQLAKAYRLPVETSDRTGVSALEALVEAEYFLERFRPGTDKPNWGELYGYIFSEHIKHPNEQREFIRSIVDIDGHDGFALNWSHACLGELVNRCFVHTVLTTNFDQLVLKGIIRTGIVPVVADGLESLSRISPTPRWPQVVHVHGSMHTYELRNSSESLRETQDDRGLQSLMLTILKETTVLVVVGYSGGEEGIMKLLQDASRALPRMVVYWIAYENDYARLSKGAKDLLEIGEYKYFILNQDSDLFFNQLLGELGIGSPRWINDPLGVLTAQNKIMSSDSTPNDLRHLIDAYDNRVRYAYANGRMPEKVRTEAIRHRSANRFDKAIEVIAAEADYRDDDELLRLHATSLVDLYKRLSEPPESMLEDAIEELTELVARGSGQIARNGDTLGAGNQSGTDEVNASGDMPSRSQEEALKGSMQGVPKLVADTEALIEAQRQLSEVMAESATVKIGKLARQIAKQAEFAQNFVHRPKREWAVMLFYNAESWQARAEHLKRGPRGRGRISTRARKYALKRAIDAFGEALTILSQTDVERARECREGLAGALSNLAELLLDKTLPPLDEEGNTLIDAQNYLRQSRALFLEVIDFSKRNTPGRKELAGAYENLADVVETTAKHQPGEAHGLRDEALRLLHGALGIYKENSDIKNAIRIQARLDSITSLNM